MSLATFHLRDETDDGGRMTWRVCLRGRNCGIVEPTAEGEKEWKSGGDCFPMGASWRRLGGLYRGSRAEGVTNDGG